MIDKVLNLLHLKDTSPNVGDAMAVGVSIASIAQFLPYISAALSALWVALRIYITVRDDLFKKDKPDGNE